MSASDLWQDKAAIIELAAKERMCRDEGSWRVMHECYYDESHVRVQWFNGTGHDFIEASREQVPEGQKWSGGLHVVGPSAVELNGDRAIADTGCTVNSRRNHEGVELDWVIFVRHRSMVERDEDGIWKLRSFRAIYQRDTCHVAVPGQIFNIDPERLTKYRQSYRYGCYFNDITGRPVDDTLPGIDRPDLVEAMIAEEEAWLAGGVYTPKM